MSFDHWLAVAAASAVMLAIPGPTILLVISYALSHGRRTAGATVAGVALGDFTAMTASMLGLGALLAAVIPSPRVASGVGAALAAVMWFFAGMWFPRALFPEWLASVAAWTPGGAAASLLEHAAGAGTIAWQPLAILLGWAVLGFAIAIRTFRWE